MRTPFCPQTSFKCVITSRGLGRQSGSVSVALAPGGVSGAVIVSRKQLLCSPDNNYFRGGLQICISEI